MVDLTNVAATRKIFSNSTVRVLLLTVAVLISLSPFALNGYWFDDSSISSTYWEAQLSGISIYQLVWNQTLAWIHASGRLIPLAILQTYGLHYWIQDVHLFRLAHILLVLIHIGTFTWLLRRLELGWNFIGLWVLLLIGLFQARNYHDPIAAYGFFLQTQGIFLTFAILSLIRWSETPRNKWLVLSSMFSIIPLLMYEINIVYYPIALGLVIITPYQKRLKFGALVALFAPFFVYVLSAGYLRHVGNVNYSGVKVGSLDLMLATYGKQFIAAFPGSFYLLQWDTEFPISKLFSTFASTPLAWLLMLVTLYSGFRCISANELTGKTASPRTAELSIIALCLTFITPVFIAISSKYQLELKWGTGYVPVYYSYFGAALILAASFSWITKRFVSLGVPSIVIVASLITANFLVNRNVIDTTDQLFVEPRSSLEHALESGLLDSLHDGDYLTVEGPAYQYLNRGFIYHHSGKKLMIEDSPVLGKPDIGHGHYTLRRLKLPPFRWQVTSP